MSVLNYLTSGFKLKKARKLAALARNKENEQEADRLFKEAYSNFSTVSTVRARYPDALHGWGLALFNQSQIKSKDESIKLLEEAINKFNLCDAVKPDHIGASLDGGVALMGLAKVKGLGINDDLYSKAKKSFLTAENTQEGSASYNLACLYALKNQASECLAALEKARDLGLVPDEQDIINDPDLDNIKQLSWFKEFIDSLDDDDTHFKESIEIIEESNTGEEKTVQPKTSTEQVKETKTTEEKTQESKVNQQQSIEKNSA